VSGEPQPSYEDLEALVALQAGRIGELEALLGSRDVRIDALEAMVGRLAAENEELRRRAGSDSSNSSRPPSSDSPYGKPKPKPSGMRGTSGRKPGKQPGEPGRTRRQAGDPDEVITVEPGCCGGCGAGLSSAAVAGVQRRQVFECRPPPPPRVVEYRVVARRCAGCGKVSRGQAPAGVSAPVQWGPSVLARAVLLTLAHYLPYGRAALVLRQLARAGGLDRVPGGCPQAGRGSAGAAHGAGAAAAGRRWAAARR